MRDNRTMPSTARLKSSLPHSLKQALRRLLLSFAAVRNAGSGVSCPCCGKSMRKFARFHGIEGQCTRCGSLMRHRALLLYLRDVLKVQSVGRHILHCAPEPALQAWLTGLPTVEYISVDLDSPRATVHADITNLPFADTTFDLVLCSHVLEHVPDDGAAIDELFRVVRPGGVALIQVPSHPLAATYEDPSVTDPAERESLFGQYDHVRLCGRDYGLRIEAAGFDVVAEDYVERLSPGTRSRFGLRAGEPFYVSTKPGTS